MYKDKCFAIIKRIDGSPKPTLFLHELLLDVRAELHYTEEAKYEPMFSQLKRYYSSGDNSLGAPVLV